MSDDELAAALARAEAAESECAELNDALDAMRMTADEVQARQRGRVQAGAWAQAAAAVAVAIDYDRLRRSVKLAGTIGCIVCGDEISAGYRHGDGIRCCACEDAA